MRRRDSDRRGRPRFEVVGELWGTVEAVFRLPLRNVGLKGALIESHVPLPVDSVHRIVWDTEGRETATQVRVRHVRPVRSADGEDIYFVGVEFVSPSALVSDQIQRWLCRTAGHGDFSGA